MVDILNVSIRSVSRCINGLICYMLLQNQHVPLSVGVQQKFIALLYTCITIGWLLWLQIFTRRSKSYSEGMCLSNLATNVNIQIHLQMSYTEVALSRRSLNCLNRS
jgi:hypothetical protein